MKIDYTCTKSILIIHMYHFHVYLLNSTSVIEELFTILLHLYFKSNENLIPVGRVGVIEYSCSDLSLIRYKQSFTQQSANILIHISTKNINHG